MLNTLFYLQTLILLCKGDIDYHFEETIVIQNTDPTISISFSATFNPYEADDASLEWADSSRSPGLDYYYKVQKSIQTTIATITLGWNTEGTDMARKDAGGTLLFTVLKNSLHLGNKTSEVVVRSDIDYLFEERFVIRNTDPTISISLSATFNSDEADDASLEWADSSRSPGLDYYYIFITSIQTRIATITLEWNTERTERARKDAGGTLLFTVLKNSLPVGNKTLEVVVHWKPETASVLRNPAAGNILRDSTLIMTCTGDRGNPAGSVTWKINGTEMTDDMYKTDVITFNAAQAVHDGDWSCYFTNSLGGGGESEIQTVEIKWMPGPCSVILNTDDDYIILGSELILACTCADKGKPTGEINWSLNGNKNYGSMYQTDVITIDSVESQHAGEWECYYMNAIGIGTSSMKTIDIKWPPGRSLLLVDTQFPKLHDSFTLTCTGDQGNPKGSVAWYLDSLIFTNTTDITLNISSAAQEHNGDWSCMFYNHLDDGGISDSVRVQVLCLPSLNVEYVSYAFNESYVHFNLRLNDESAADTVNVQVCSTPNDEPLCSTASSKLENKELISDVELPEPSDHTLYNVTFIFSHGSRIVSRHGIALRGNEKQRSTSTIFAAVFGALWIITAGIAAVVIVLYHRRLKEKDVNPPKEKGAEVHYVNVGAETGTENTTYMDLDQNDVQQTRNRPAELTVYQSLH